MNEKYSQTIQQYFCSRTTGNKRPAGHHNPPPRPRDRNFTGCILPWSLTFCSTIMIHLSRLVCILQIFKSMLVASQHLASYGIFVPRVDAVNRFMHYQCWILLVDLNFMCFSLAKKTFFTLKSDPFFARVCSKTIFMGFRKGGSPFAVNGDCTQLRRWLTLLLLCRFQKLW